MCDVWVCPWLWWSCKFVCYEYIHVEMNVSMWVCVNSLCVRMRIFRISRYLICYWICVHGVWIVCEYIWEKDCIYEDVYMYVKMLCISEYVSMGMWECVLVSEFVKLFVYVWVSACECICEQAHVREWKLMCVCTGMNLCVHLCMEDVQMWLDYEHVSVCIHISDHLCF